MSNHIRREHDFFEANLLDYILENYPKQKVILDIGANIGNHTLFFAHYLKYRTIHAFEPIPENLKILEANTKNYNKVRCWNYALSNKTGALRMTTSAQNMGVCVVDPDGPYKVDCRTLDSHLYSDVTLMKIDVERHEPQILEGAKDTINRNHPLIIIEDEFDSYLKLLPIGYEKINRWDITSLYEFRG